VSHCGLARYIKKYLNAKEELWKFQYFIEKSISVIFVILDAPRKGLQNLFNIQRLLINAKKIIKL